MRRQSACHMDMKRHDLERLLYRAQVSFGLTRTEFHGLLIFALILAMGVAAREWHLRIPSVDPAVYAELEAEFRRRAARLPPPPMVGPVLPELPPPDSIRAAPLFPQEALVNLNTASSAELESLPRIGPALAARIIAHRETVGPFRSASDLLMVRGIGEATLERLRLLVTVQPAGRDH